ncbi:MAG: hypothetical protein QXS20_00090 [Candidatus Thorarchaeota archaeon]
MPVYRYGAFKMARPSMPIDGGCREDSGQDEFVPVTASSRDTTLMTSSAVDCADTAGY